MCVCEATELEAYEDTSATFTVIEQSPAGVTWSYEVTQFGEGFLGILDAEGAWEPKLQFIFADSSIDELFEMVVVDETYVYLGGQSGIYRVPVADLDLPGLTVHDGVGIIDFDPHDDYRFYASGNVDDFDIADGWVWWIEGRTVYKLGLLDFGGTPVEVIDVTADYAGSESLLLAANEDRIWLLDRQEDPMLRAYQHDGDEIEAIQLISGDSEGNDANVRATDMTVERDTGAVVIVARTPGD